MNTRLKAMSSFLSDISDGFGDAGALWYGFIYELVSNIHGYASIETGGVVWVYLVG